MGWRQPDLSAARQAIQHCLGEIRSPYNDGWVSGACKRDLFMLKSWLEDEYARLPEFSDEETWQQERLVDILKQSHK